ncbi:MAG: hypothetical protein B6245_11415 [Desulfobacteraceae bacterium 4572_88]|nr:MAG: hypothetical protein B6245_11415 [Desulfobacteraceae bacterium 4572_88]
MNEALKKRLICWALLLIILCAAGIRWHLLEIPLERDEGEYAYAGQLILQGIPPYEQMYNMKLPGVYAAYACILTIFGQTHMGIHLGLLFINAATIVLIFLVARRVAGAISGISAAACFALLSVSQSVQGVFANAEHFVILPAVGGALLLLRGTEDERPCALFFSGLLMGTGFLMKQHGVAFMAFGSVYLLAKQLGRRPVNLRHLILQCALFSAGAVIPYGLTCLILALAGVFDKFWFWTVEYAMAYASQVPPGLAWELFSDRALRIGGSAPLIWMLSGFGLIALFLNKQLRSKSFFIFIFAAFSFMAICPGFYFRPHYFVLLLPAAALLAGVGIRFLADALEKRHLHVARYRLPVLLLIICLLVSFFQQREFLFQMTPAQACRATYGRNPFPESLEISKAIRTLTKKEDRIAVIGSEPQIYFYSDRRSATGYIYMYAMMEHHDFAMQMQKEMIQEIESASPEILVMVNVRTSWLTRPDSHQLLFEWLRTYQTEHYTLVGLAEISKKEATVYHWIPNVKWPPKSPAWVAVMKRKP